MISSHSISSLVTKILFSFVSYQLPRKPRFSRQKEVVSRSHNKFSEQLSNEGISKPQLELTTLESQSPHFTDNEVATAVTATACQLPIGTAAVSSESQAIR